jgi:hypothetical protein
LTIEFVAVPGFPPLGVLPFSPALVSTGPKIKNAVVAFGRLPAPEEEGLRKCGSLVFGNGLNLVTESAMQGLAKLSPRLFPAAAVRKLQIDFGNQAPKEKITVVARSNGCLL